jgi:hypothetical protein
MLSPGWANYPDRLPPRFPGAWDSRAELPVHPRYHAEPHRSFSVLPVEKRVPRHAMRSWG